MNTLSHDIRYAFRMLVKHPGSSLVVMATLALVVGVMTLALGAREQSRRAWMSFPDAGGLVRLWRIDMSRPSAQLPASVYADAVRTLKGLESVGALGGYESIVLLGAGAPQSLTGIRVSASVFDAAQVLPVRGRTFTAEEERPGNDQVVVLSYGAWQEIFGGEESILGKPVRLNDATCTVIGVMPCGFDRNALFYGPDLWLPGDFESPVEREPWVQVVGRRRAGVSTSQLQAELDAVLTPALRSHVETHGADSGSSRVNAFPLDRQFGRIDVGEVVFIVAVPALALLIAGFNIANLLLARMIRRRRELAVRVALGASRTRVVRLLLTESVLLALCGGIAGVVATVWLSDWFATRGLEVRFSPHVLFAACAGAVTIGLVVGWLPALRATHGGLSVDLKERGAGGIERHGLRNFLVVGQVGMATALCITAGLLVRSYLNRKQFDPGFETRNLVEIGTSPAGNADEGPQARLLYCRQVLGRLQSLPEVAEVEVASTNAIERDPFPMGFRRENDDGHRRPEAVVRLNVVSPGYLRMIGLPVLRGRSVAGTDRRGTGRVLLVNQACVDAFFAEADPIGRQIQLSVESQPEWFTVVGVVPDRRNLGYREDLGPEAYLCSLQVAPEWAHYRFLIRTQTAPGALQKAIREAVRSVDYNRPVGDPRMVELQLQAAAERDNAGRRIITAIGLFGLLMAAFGIYGVVSSSVVERAHEMGVRMALGGRRADILTLVLKQGLKLTVVGLAVGMAFAALSTFGISQMLFGIRALDPVCYMAVALILTVTSTCAGLIPARRAARVDPMAALRCE